MARSSSLPITHILRRTGLRAPASGLRAPGTGNLPCPSATLPIVAERARHPLTPPLSFRRDVRMFLGVLTGFLVIVVLVLLVMMRNFFVDTEEAIESQWRTIAAASAAQLSAASTEPELDRRALDILERGDV